MRSTADGITFPMIFVGFKTFFMKKMIAVFAFAIVAFAACTKIKDLVQITVPLKSTFAFDIPAIPVAGAFPAITIPTPQLHLDSIIKAQNSAASLDNIKEAHLTACTLTLAQFDTANNFSAIKDCTIQIASTANSTFQTIASVANNPDVASGTLNLNVNSSLDLKPYFEDTTGTISYRIQITTRKPTTTQLSTTAALKYNITVGL